ncbi:MAG: hypothetical protein ABGW82_11895, partial [Paracoccus sp. (in: a-proteobacteria)]
MAEKRVSVRLAAVGGRQVRAELLLLVATIVGVNIGLIILMAVSLERVDHARRKAERELVH